MCASMAAVLLCAALPSLARAQVEVAPFVGKEHAARIGGYTVAFARQDRAD